MKLFQLKYCEKECIRTYVKKVSQNAKKYVKVIFLILNQISNKILFIKKDKYLIKNTIRV